MPEVRRVQLSAHRTVASAISRVREISLPDEMANDALAVWIIGHDAIEHADADAVEPLFQWSREGDLVQALVYFVASEFKRRIPIYFGILFHIGRVWQVSLGALRDIKTLESSVGLTSAASQLAETPDTESADSAVGPMIEKSCSAAQRLHTARVSQAQAWWQQWKLEVAALRDSYLAVQQAFNETRGLGAAAARVLTATRQSSRLLLDLEKDGVRISEGTPARRDDFMAFLLAAFIAEDERLVQTGLEVLRNVAEVERERTLVPRVEVHLEVLRVRHRDGDPFARFDSRCEPAQEDLGSLSRQHRLPGGEDSPWLAQWKARLGRGLSLDAEPSRHVDRERMAQLVDVELKLAASRAEPSSNDSWSGFLQREFETRWVTVLARGAVKPSAGHDWSPEEFLAFLEPVVEASNALGYTLTAPPLPRIRKLFDLLGETPWWVREGSW